MSIITLWKVFKIIKVLKWHVDSIFCGVCGKKEFYFDDVINKCEIGKLKVSKI